MDKSTIAIILYSLMSGLLLANFGYMLVSSMSIKRRQDALKKEIDRIMKSSTKSWKEN